MRSVHLPISTPQRLRLALFAGIVLFAAFISDAHARVDPPPPVPSGLSAEQTRSLNAQRDALMMEYQTIAGHVREHNAQCRRVPESDARMTAQCRQSNARIDAEEAAYRGRMSAYQTRLQSTQREVQFGSAEVSGNVWLFLPDGSMVSGGRINDTAIPFGTRVRTDGSGRMRMTLVDGTNLTVGPGSDIILDEYSPVRCLISVVRGYLRAQVRTQFGRRFEVRTGGSTGAVRGTDFEVQVNSDGSESFSLREGQVEVRVLATNRLIVLSPGQTVRISAAGIVSLE